MQPSHLFWVVSRKKTSTRLWDLFHTATVRLTRHFSSMQSWMVIRQMAVISENSPLSSIFKQFYSEELVAKLGSPRCNGEPVTQHVITIAVGSQIALETVLVPLVTNLHQKTGENIL